MRFFGIGDWRRGSGIPRLPLPFCCWSRSSGHSGPRRGGAKQLASADYPPGGRSRDAKGGECGRHVPCAQQLRSHFHPQLWSQTRQRSGARAGTHGGRGLLRQPEHTLPDQRCMRGARHPSGVRLCHRHGGATDGVSPWTYDALLPLHLPRPSAPGGLCTMCGQRRPRPSPGCHRLHASHGGPQDNGGRGRSVRGQAADVRRHVHRFPHLQPQAARPWLRRVWRHPLHHGGDGGILRLQIVLRVLRSRHGGRQKHRPSAPPLANFCG
mmetsp:Transcript_41387/g.69230  ORF Transcript_41387/g.69230 Transcript_41387/m.69230 type:complete len:267 (-) Transcript_41387:47-847(-)